MNPSNDLVTCSVSYLEERPVHLELGALQMAGSLGMVAAPRAVVMIASDKGSARHRPLELQLAQTLRGRGCATLMIDLLTPDEQGDQEGAASLRLDAAELARRLSAARRWIAGQAPLANLPVGVVAEGGAGAAALVDAAGCPRDYAALVLCSSQPLRAGFALDHCHVPALLIVEARDTALLSLNRAALTQLRGEVQLATLCAPGSEQAIELIETWFARHLFAGAAMHSPGCACRPSASLDH